MSDLSLVVLTTNSKDGAAQALDVAKGLDRDGWIETKAAIENHLLAVELSLRKQRAKLQDNFEERLLQLKQWFENLHVRSTLAQAEARDKLQASIKAAQHSLAELRAHLRTRNREDERAWKDIRQGFNKTWKDLEEAFDQASRERV